MKKTYSERIQIIRDSLTNIPSVKIKPTKKYRPDWVTHFLYENIECRYSLMPYKGAGPGCMKLIFKFDNKKQRRIKIVSNGFWVGRGFLRLQGWFIGGRRLKNKELEEFFYLYTNDFKWSEKFLSAEIIKTILEYKNDGISLNIKTNSVVFSKDYCNDFPSDCTKFIENGLKIIDVLSSL